MSAANRGCPHSGSQPCWEVEQDDFVGRAATTCTPGSWHIARMQSADAFPMDLAFAGKGNTLPRH